MLNYLLTKIKLSLRNLLLVSFLSLALAVGSLLLIFFYFHQNQLNKFILNSANDSMIVVNQTISICHQQLDNESKIVGHEVLKAHIIVANELYSRETISQSDLKALQRSISSQINKPVEINIINDRYKIIQSTYPKELGLDLGKFPDAYNALHKIKSSHGIKIDAPVFEPAGGLFRAYTLSYLKEKKLFLQLAVSLTEHSNIFELLKNVADQSETISEIDLFVVQEDFHQELYVSSFTISDHTLSPAEKKHVTVCAQTGKTIIEQHQNNNKLYRDYYSLVGADHHKANWFPDLNYFLVYRLCVDITAQHQLQKSFIGKATVIFSLIFLCLIICWYLFQRTFANPLNTIVKHIKKSEFVENHVCVAELEDIGLNYNEHLQEIRSINKELKDKIEELTKSHEKIKTLSSLLPMCANCHKIRDDAGYWTRVEMYMSQHLDINVSHGICPQCIEELYPEIADRIRNKKSNL